MPRPQLDVSVLGVMYDAYRYAVALIKLLEKFGTKFLHLSSNILRCTNTKIRRFLAENLELGRRLWMELQDYYVLCDS